MNSTATDPHHTATATDTITPTNDPEEFPPGMKDHSLAWWGILDPVLGDGKFGASREQDLGMRYDGPGETAPSRAAVASGLHLAKRQNQFDPPLNTDQHYHHHHQPMEHRPAGEEVRMDDYRQGPWPPREWWIQSGTLFPFLEQLTHPIIRNMISQLVSGTSALRNMVLAFG